MSLVKYNSSCYLIFDSERLNASMQQSFLVPYYPGFLACSNSQGCQIGWRCWRCWRGYLRSLCNSSGPIAWRNPCITGRLYEDLLYLLCYKSTLFPVPPAPHTTRYPVRSASVNDTCYHSLLPLIGYLRSSQRSVARLQLGCVDGVTFTGCLLVDRVLLYVGEILSDD